MARPHLNTLTVFGVVLIGLSVWKNVSVTVSPKGQLEAKFEVPLYRLLGSDHDNMLVIHQKNPIRIPFVMLRSHFLRVKTVL